MPSFGKLFKSKDASKKAAAPSTNGNAAAKPQWVDSWLRTRVDPDEVVELLHGCTKELKSRALDVPFLLLPFRPSSDPSAARTFVRNYFLPLEGRPKLKGEKLMAELKMTEVMVLISVMKWCWARLPGGIVSWETYKMFKIGEKDSHFARDAYSTFIPISVDSKARAKIINDFFDLLAAIAAHGKSNGLGGHKLSRYAGWWAFEHYDTGKGFDAGYKSWTSAADATSHLFFAYLRSLAPEPGKTNGILDLPRSLQQMVAATSYPPPSSLMRNDTTKLVMIVDVVSPTPYALLRRAKNFEYRDDDKALRDFADYDDPVQALTDECRRVLRAISNTNQSHVSDAKTSTSLTDPSWSRFEDIGFSSALDEIHEEDSVGLFSHSTIISQGHNSINSIPRVPAMDLNRPTTPSWADFLSSGFTEENGNGAAPILLPPDKILPPIISQSRGQSSQSHRRGLDNASTLEPGELASITRIAIDDAFWWVWISSLAGEEPTSRKAVFGRCAYIETSLADGHWMIMEEQVKGAAPEPAQGAYIAEKKGFLGFTTKKGRLTRRRSGLKKNSMSSESNSRSDLDPSSRTTLAPDQQARIRNAALELSKKKKAEEAAKDLARGRKNENDALKTNSVYTMGALMKDEASPALQWTKQYDKNAIRKQYLGSDLAGKGSTEYLSSKGASKSTSSLVEPKDRDLPPVPRGETNLTVPSPPPQVPEKIITPPAATEPTALPAQPKMSLSHDAPRHTTEGNLPPASPVLSNVETESIVRATSSRGTSSPESNRKGPAPNGRQNGIKRLFGTMRRNRDESDHGSPPSTTESNQAVAAARRALEGKANGNPATDSPPLSPNHFNKYQSVKSRAAAFSQKPVETKPAETVLPVERNIPASAPAVPAPAAISAPVPASVLLSSAALAPVSAPTQVSAPVPEPAYEAVAESEPESQADVSEPTPPRTRRDEEFDRLSRVDTKEREQADQEFSRFDQGPLVSQPAFVPEDSSTKGDYEDDVSFRTKHQSVYSAVTLQTEATDEDSHPEISRTISPNDRWAQIRRNAAERAARSSEDQGNRSRTETRTDDGDTSGEETIESRVARIKARVAELTGNMEQTRR